MSRTKRRTHFNKKTRFFTHYWECFSKAELLNSDYISEYKYHSDNYYTKHTKDRKQCLKNVAERVLRQEFRLVVQKIKTNLDICENISMLDKPRSIKWDLH